MNWSFLEEWGIQPSDTPLSEGSIPLNSKNTSFSKYGAIKRIVILQLFYNPCLARHTFSYYFCKNDWETFPNEKKWIVFIWSNEGSNCFSIQYKNFGYAKSSFEVLSTTIVDCLEFSKLYNPRKSSEQHGAIVRLITFPQHVRDFPIKGEPFTSVNDKRVSLVN